MRTWTILLLLASSIAACSSESTEPAKNSDSGIDGSATMSCGRACAVISATKCTTDAAVQTNAACVAECEVAASAATSCGTAWEAFVGCCTSRGVASECTDDAVTFRDCGDACKLEGERLDSCVRPTDSGSGG